MSSVVTTGGFIVLAVVALALLLLPRMAPHRFLSNVEMLESLFYARITRFALVVVWWWVGWHFLGTG